jgi:hypothetical protein
LLQEQILADLIGLGIRVILGAVGRGNREMVVAHRLPGSSPALTLAERAVGQPAHCVLSVYPNWGDAEKVVP